MIQSLLYDSMSTVDWSNAFNWNANINPERSVQCVEWFLAIIFSLIEFETTTYYVSAAAVLS